MSKISTPPPPDRQNKPRDTVEVYPTSPEPSSVWDNDWTKMLKAVVVVLVFIATCKLAMMIVSWVKEILISN